MADSVRVYEVDAEGREGNTSYRVDCSIDQDEEVRQKLRKLLVDESGVSLLETHAVTVEPLQEVERAAAGASIGSAETSSSTDFGPLETGSQIGGSETSGPGDEAAPDADDTSATQPGDSAGDSAGDSDAGAPSQPASDAADGTAPESGTDGSADNPAADAASPVEPNGDQSSRLAPRNLLLAQADDAAQQVQQLLNAVGNSATSPESGAESSTESGTDVTTTFSFDQQLNAGTVRRLFREAADELNVSMAGDVDLDNEQWTGSDAEAFTSWKLTIPASLADAQRLVDHVTSKLATQPVWLSSSTFGSQVAGNMQRTAIVAILVSLVGIIGYIWIRFQRMIFGLAAVVALVHDVLVTLGAIALSHWLFEPLGFLGIEDFRISLPVVAAMLTIIGYSLNDTIVVFDRIREVRGRSPNITEEMINTSVNQTLSRTLLTSLTTLLVVSILYSIGGAGIHAFSYALLVGVIVGTYSSIYVAAPILLWLTDKDRPGGSRAKASA